MRYPHRSTLTPPYRCEFCGLTWTVVVQHMRHSARVPDCVDRMEQMRNTQQSLSDLDNAELGVYLGLPKELRRGYSTPPDDDESVSSSGAPQKDGQ